jgi:hypothetical protein
MDNSTTQTKWYDKTWLVIVLCIIFFPVGLYALWKNQSISKGWKIGVTVVIALIVLAQIGKDEKGGSSTDNSANSSSKSELTQAQKDSIETEKKRQAELEAQQKREQEIAEKSLDVAQFFKDYEGNEAAADKRYKDKEFIVSGKVKEVKKDFFGYIYAIIEVGGYKVRCDLPDKDYAASIEIGTNVTLIGICDGMGAGQSLGISSAIMRKCKPY